MQFSMPPFLASMNFRIEDLDRAERGDAVDLIDDHLIPRGATTYIATDAGSGKSSSAIVSCASASSTGVWNFLGRKKHARHLKCAVILGEDNRTTLRSAFANLGEETRRNVRNGYELGNLMICPFKTFSRTLENRKVFDEKGSLTETGEILFAALRKWKPDVIVLDTNTALAEGSFLSKVEAEKVTYACDELAEECNAAVIVFMHLNREGSGKLTKDCSASDITNNIAGSIQIKNSTRHMLAFARSPEGRFDNIKKDLDDGDELWMCGVKTNIIKDAANKIYPVVRDASMMVMRTSSPDGDYILGDSDSDREKRVQKMLFSKVPALIQAASEARSPFAKSGKVSLEQMSPQFRQFLDGATETQVAKCIQLLESEGIIVPCKTSRTGGSVVLDIRGGVFANEAEYESLCESKLEFRKGALNAFELSVRAAEIIEKNIAPEMFYLANRGGSDAVDNEVRDEPSDDFAPF